MKIPMSFQILYFSYLLLFYLGLVISLIILKLGFENTDLGRYICNITLILGIIWFLATIIFSILETKDG